MTLEKAERSEPPINWVVPSLKTVDLRNRMLYTAESRPEYNSVKNEFMTEVSDNHLLGMYLDVADRLKWTIDQRLVVKCETELENRLNKIDEKIKDSEKNYGDAEIVDAMVERGHVFAETGDIESAIEDYLKAAPKLLGSEGRATNALNIARLCLLLDAKHSVKRKYMEYATNEIEKNGDWEKRNKLKIYVAFMDIYKRSFQSAAKTLLDALTTYSATELMTFTNFVKYTIFLNILTVDRSDLKSKLVFAPEVIQVCMKDQLLKEFMMSYYEGRYDSFFRSLIDMSEKIKIDPFLRIHYLYIIRLVRLRAYKQFLEPFKSVTIDNMADSFGVTTNFLDVELTSFIASSKLSCKIDKVSGVISKDHINKRTTLYTKTIKDGDVLLNNIERLSKILC